MKLAQHAFFRSKTRSCYKRIFLASVAVKAISSKLSEKHNMALNLINCLEIYFTGTSDPLISLSEVKNLLYVCCTKLKKLYKYEKLCEVFHMLMPDCPARLEPRKLTHLARCQIRQSLSKCNDFLPEAVEKIGFPYRMERFIVGDLIDISRRKYFGINMESRLSVWGNALDDQGYVTFPFLGILWLHTPVCAHMVYCIVISPSCIIVE